MPGAVEMFDFKSISKVGAGKVKGKIEKFVRFDKLSNEFNDLQNTSLYKKLAYPFKSPGMIFICSVYLIAHFVFGLYAYGGELTSAAAAAPRDESSIRTINQWYLFYTFATIFFNAYAFAVPMYWVMVILLFIAGVICSCLASSDNSD